MSGPLGSSQWMYSSGGFYPYEIGQSLRFNDNDSAYLSWTPASVGNRKTWTWSGWFKRGNITNATMNLFNAYSGSGSASTFIQWTASNQFQFQEWNGSSSVAAVKLNSIHRDVSSWYHLIVAVDTTQATASDRVKIYVNGELQTSLALSTYMSQNYDCYANNTIVHTLGIEDHNNTAFFDGYMAEVNFIDGSALDPTSFGEFRSGIWVPKAYSGSYGTNGFYLPFSDSAAIGDDLSGNGNDWTPSGLASTDVMLDSPTNNFATLNPLATSCVLEDGNLKVASGSTHNAVKSTMAITSGMKVYVECTLNESPDGFWFGLTPRGYNETGYTTTDRTGLYSNSTLTIFYGSGAGTGLGSRIISNGETWAIAVDFDDSRMYLAKIVSGTPTWYARDGSTGSQYAPDGASDNLFEFMNADTDLPLFVFAAQTGQARLNFGQHDYQISTVPEGFTALNTANLPAPAIDPAVDDVPADYFNTVLYTGNGSTNAITGVGFQPDLLWTKGRSSTTIHYLQDAVRGVDNALFSNLTDAEFSIVTTDTTFDADGFTFVGPESGLNANTVSYVAWNWLAGNGTSSNTDGTITSTVSVNQKAGFSIATVAAQNNTSTLTVGHGLGAAPKLLIGKSRSGVGGWSVWHPALATNELLYLHSTAAKSVDGGTPPAAFSATSSTTFTVQHWNRMIGNGATGVFYAFAEVEGFSKFGSYTGNGSTDGPFVYCGFRPAFVMVKRTNTTGDWVLKDAERPAYNTVDLTLTANTSNAEAGNNLQIDFTANGFKWRDNGGNGNASGGTYIFAAFAEQPFKFSNAR